MRKSKRKARRGRDYPQVFSEMSQTLAQALRERVRITEADATAIADRAIEVLRTSLAKRELYIPAAASIELSKRDREIYARFRSGWDMLDLQEEYNLSRMMLHNIINACRAKMVEASNYSLFPDAPQS